MAWNVFKFCTSLRGLGSIVILLVLGVVGVTYYAVVINNYWPGLEAGEPETLLSLAVLILFHCLLAMLLWSYFSVVFTEPGIVPPNWRPKGDEEKGDTDQLTSTEFSADVENGRIRFCRKCNQLKPPRCHHCSVCGKCVLKMDHHCVWVVNCVGALNYKYFLLFLFYTFLETSLVTLSLLPHFILFFTDDDIPGTPGTLATTFLAFGKVKYSFPKCLFFSSRSSWLLLFYSQSFWICSIELSIFFERFGNSDYAHIISGSKYHNH
ncbi:probable S-acyltransferase 14 [Olea europaea subsp. europaea]|uniref:S-acyltransferase n=1 Tax=Olea europaea subsp. europaea TaxID=158383 RepID=A0A8S0UX89_OLEEU|nr:probable S-acyltransferase 14 [Olea europaea subsp. europaea]